MTAHRREAWKERLAALPFLRPLARRVHAGDGPELVAAGILVLVAVSNLRLPVLLDDAYITFRCARNFAEGHGLTFNPGSGLACTTAPGFAVILAAAHAVGVDVVLAARLISVLALLVAGWALMRAAKELWSWEAGFAAALPLFAFGPVLAHWGNECVPLLALFSLGWLAFLKRWPVRCALAMVAGAVVRPDFALAAVILACFWLPRGWRDFARYALVGAVVSLPWLAFLHAQYGTLLPDTLHAKMFQGELMRTGDPRAFPEWKSFARGLKWFIHVWFMESILGLFAILGGSLMLLARKGLAPFLWAGLHVGVYLLILRVPFYPWYAYPIWFCYCLGAGVGIAAVPRLVRDDTGGPLGTAWLRLAVLASLSLYGALAGYLKYRSDFADQKYVAYNAMASEIARIVPKGSTVMLDEVGQMGYLSDRTIVDTHGLVTRIEDTRVIRDTALLLAAFKPDYWVDTGWTEWQAPDFAARSRAGTFEVRVQLPDGTVEVYRQVARAEGGPLVMPTLLKRVTTGK